MYQLTRKMLKRLRDDLELRLKVAMVMGNSEQAIIKSINGENKGRSIAEHYDAVNRLIDETGLTTHEIREQSKTSK